MAGDNSALRLVVVHHRRAQVRAGQGARLHVLLPVALAGAQRQAALDALHGAAVRLRSSGRDAFMTGSGTDRYALAAAMSDAWVAFARTGQPESRRAFRHGLPYKPTAWPTMVFGPSRTGQRPVR